MEKQKKMPLTKVERGSESWSYAHIEVDYNMFEIYSNDSKESELLNKVIVRENNFYMSENDVLFLVNSLNYDPILKVKAKEHLNVETYQVMGNKEGMYYMMFVEIADDFWVGYYFNEVKIYTSESDQINFYKERMHPRIKKPTVLILGT